METNIIEEVKYAQGSPRTIFCILIMKDGWEVHGFSACKNVEFFDEELGKKLAYEHAVRRLNEFIDNSSKL